jgi:hypothetical protein
LHAPANIHFIETTGQGAFKMTYWAVEPNTSFPTFDLKIISAGKPSHNSEEFF